MTTEKRRRLIHMMVASACCITAALAQASIEPPPPATITSIVANSPGSITVKWTDPAYTESEFRLLRRTDGGALEFVKSFPASSGYGATISYTDSTLKPCTRYCYQIATRNSGGVAMSDFACASTPAMPVKSNLDLSQINVASVEDTNVTIGFDRSASWASGHKFYVRPATTAQYSAPSPGPQVTGLLPESEYCFIARPYDCAGEGIASNEVCARTMRRRAAQPTIVSVMPGTNSLTVTWRDNATDEDGYRVTLSGSITTRLSGSYGPMAGGTRSHTFSNLTPNTTYTVSVAAVKTGAPASTLTAQATTLPASKPDLYVDSLSGGPSSSSYFRYRVCNSGSDSPGFNVAARLDGADIHTEWISGLAGGQCTTVRSFAVTNLAAGSHQYAVMADVNGQVAELNDTNNASYLTVFIQ